MPGSGSGTRAAVARVLMEQGPVTAALVAGELGLTEAAVRRHLDALIADGEAEVRAPARSARPRGRGRPAREYLLTDTGRVRFGHGYDDLATSALRFLAETAGEQAVDAFARRRVRDLLGADMDSVTALAAPQDRAEALARVLSARGYAAQTRRGGLGVQLCQHHCPVAHVATEFPELCEAETRAFADLLGTHVQRLATIARGDAACTTHVPLEDPEHLGRAKHHEKRRAGAGGPQASVPRTRQVHEVDRRSGTESGRPTSQVRQVQEEDGPAGSGSISHHGPRKGGSPNDDHS
ncbi:transcriptional regulator [Pseudonocardia sp. NPDC049635]|uniref:helix-turn-helix transcriptional regulator n=1 Tax=Pseudonocardia sp. NPDC049635 TaxID=3155506 RepID=UPI0033FE94F8